MYTFSFSFWSGALTKLFSEIYSTERLLAINYTQSDFVQKATGEKHLCCASCAKVLFVFTIPAKYFAVVYSYILLANTSQSARRVLSVYLC